MKDCVGLFKSIMYLLRFLQTAKDYLEDSVKFYIKKSADYSIKDYGKDL